VTAPPHPKRATYDDLLQVPDHLVAEIVDGDLYTSPRPRPRHAKAATSLAMRLGPPYQFGEGGPGGWLILIEPELHLGEDVLVPDLAGWRIERLSELPEEVGITVAPDWICEVISPSTGRLDRVKKLPIYARERVAHAWLIDPLQRTLEVLRLQDGRWTVIGLHAGDDTVSAEPFDAVALKLAFLWA
jgi:Uma2 family endonuclease